MRILHLTDHYPPVIGGIERHVAGLAERQARRGDRVTVLTSTPRRADGHTSADVGPVHVLRAASLFDGFRTDVGRFDLVHAHVSVVAPFSAPLTGVFARRGVPTVVTVHSLWNGMGPFPMWAAAVSGLRSAPVTWTSVSPVAAEQVRRRLPGQARVRVLPNAVEVPALAKPRAEDGVVRLVSTMRVAARKRPLELVRVFDRVRRSTSVPLRLTIVGDGPLRPKVEQLIRRLRLADDVRVTGRVDAARVLGLLAASDVYVAPAVLESFGLAALEARSVGLPVVGRTGTGLSGFIQEGVEGLLCDSDAEMVEALADLVEDDDLRRWIGAHNRTVPADMTWARSLRAHDRVYAQALGHPIETVMDR